MHLAKDDAIMVWGLLGIGVVVVLLGILFAYQPPIQPVGEQITNQTQDHGNSDDDPNGGKTTPPPSQDFIITNGDRFRLSDRLLATLSSLTGSPNDNRPGENTGGGSDGGGGGGGNGGGGSSRDRTPPDVTGIFSRPADTIDDWYTRPFTVTWVGEDDDSGIDFCDQPTSYSGPDGSSIELEGHCTDEAGNEGTGDVEFNYNATRGGNSRPVAMNDLATTIEDAAIVVNVTGNDFDLDGDSLSISFTQAGNGTVAPNGNGTLTYAPQANYNGQDFFTYKVSDGSLESGFANVSISIASINDPPLAGPQSVVTNEDTPLGITLTGDDADGGVLIFTVVSPPSHGSITGDGSNITYVPAADFNGQDSLAFKANDEEADSTPATVNITISPVNDAPVANAQTISTPENTAVAIVLTGADVDGGSLIFWIVSGPSHGNLGAITPVNSTSATALYVPAADYEGEDSFSFLANDGSLNSSSATVSITVTRQGHNAPIAAADRYSTAEDVQLTVVAPGVLDNDSDVDAGSLSAVLEDGPISGTLRLNANGSFTYIPVANFNGVDSFTYHANDGVANSNTVVVSITVSAVNDAPVSNAGQDQIVDESILCKVNDEKGSGKEDDWNECEETDCEADNSDALTEVASGRDNEECPEPNKVELSGSGSDLDGDLLTFKWEQIGGPSVELSNANSLTPSFISPEVDEDTLLTFELAASDGLGGVGKDAVDILVLDGEGNDGKIKVKGEGKIGKDVKFSFKIQSKDEDTTGQLKYRDKDSDIKLRSISLTSLKVNEDKDQAAFEGIGEVDGEEYRFVIEVEDNGESGKKDKFAIEIAGLSYGLDGTLSKGNIEIHD